MGGGCIWGVGLPAGYIAWSLLPVNKRNRNRAQPHTPGLLVESCSGQQASAPGTGSGAGGPGAVSAHLAQRGFPNYPAQRACTAVASGFCMGPLAVQETRQRPSTEGGRATGALQGLWGCSRVRRAEEHHCLCYPHLHRAGGGPSQVLWPARKVTGVCPGTSPPPKHISA